MTVASFASLVRTRETAIWLLLMLLTLTSWLLGANHGLVTDDADWGVITLLALAFFKVRLVIRWFMEARHAPAELKWSCEAYVVCSFLLVAGFSTGMIG